MAGRGQAWLGAVWFGELGLGMACSGSVGFGLVGRGMEFQFGGTMATKQSAAALQVVSNGGADDIAREEPYVVEITVEGVSAILFHRWDCDAVQAKAKARKGSTAKKEDNVESYVYRNGKNEISIPGEYFRMAIINAAKFSQDPRSPRKSAMDLFKAGIAVVSELCSLGTEKWDFLDQRRVGLQRNSITRMRPAMFAGWKAAVELQVLLPEYITPHILNEVTGRAGRLIGVGDFRPTYGRFQINVFDVRNE